MSIISEDLLTQDDELADLAEAASQAARVRGAARDAAAARDTAQVHWSRSGTAEYTDEEIHHSMTSSDNQFASVICNLARGQSILQSLSS